MGGADVAANFLGGSGLLVFLRDWYPRGWRLVKRIMYPRKLSMCIVTSSTPTIYRWSISSKSVARTALDNKKAKPYSPVVDTVLKDVARRLQRSAKNEERYLDEIKADPHKTRNKNDIINSEREFIVDLFREWYNNLGRPLPPGSALSARVLNSYLPLIALGFIRREMIPLVYSGPLDLALAPRWTTATGRSP